MIIFGPVFENIVMEKKQIEQICMKAIRDFQINRPHGIRIDSKRRAITLFNRKYNLLGKNENGSIDTLPVEPYDIEDIPLSLAQKAKKSGDILDLSFSYYGIPILNDDLRSKLYEKEDRAFLKR